MTAYVHVDPEISEMVAKVYNSLREFVALSGEGPSKMQLAHSCLLSTVSVYKAEKILVKKGYITSPKGESRMMRPTDLDRVLAHQPVDPWDELDLDKPKFWRV